ncbi:MAG TPA: hypothetical protein DDW29_15410 [Gammaproteobacteria bacterium]|nr:hypothetical protein [Gammaproteobacteria bacterium]|tara:strand:+ start:13466 stop:17443 length:3978 start_codon:yes stop_codon:yes gene_type:complete
MSDLNKLSDQPPKEEQETQDNTQERPSHPWLFRFMVELPAGILVISVCLALIIILTAFGRTLTSNIVLNFIPLPEHYSLRVNDFESPTIGEWRFNTLALEYKNMPFIYIEKGIFDWTALDIIKGEIHLERLSAQHIQIHQSALSQIAKDNPKKEKEPNKTLEETLADIDSKINEQLKRISLRVMPVTLSNLSLQKIEFIQEKQTITLSTKGEIKAGKSSDIAEISLNTSVVLPSMPEPLHVLSKLKLNYDHELAFSFASSYYAPDILKMPIAAQLNGRIRFDDKEPLKVYIVSSPLQVDKESAELKGVIGFDSNQINIEQLTLTALGGFIEAEGAVGLDEEESSLLVNIMQVDPSSFIPDAQQLSINGNLAVQGNIKSPRIIGSVSGIGTYGNAPISASTDLEFNTAAFSFHNTLLQLDQAQATASGTFDFQNKTLDINTHPQGLNLGQLSAFKVPIPEQVDLTIQDAIADIRVEFIGGGEKPKVDLTTQGLFSGTIFSVPSDINGQIKLNLDGLSLNNTKTIVQGAEANASGEVNWKDKVLDLQFKTKKITPESLSWLPVTLPPELKTNLNADINLSGTFEAPKITINATGPLSYNELALNTKCNLSTNLKSLNLKSCQFFQPEDKANAIMIHKGNIQFSPLDIKLNHQFNLFPIKLLSKAIPQTHSIRNDLQLEGRLQGAATSHIAPHSKTQAIELKKLTTDLGFFGTAWNKPLFGGARSTIEMANNQLVLNIKSLGLDFGQESHLTVKADVDAKNVDAQIKGELTAKDLQALPIPNFESFTQWPGQLKIATELQGLIKKPNVSGAIEYLAQIQQLNASGTNKEVPLKIAMDFKSPELEELIVDATVYKNNQKQSQFELKTNAIAVGLSKAFSKTSKDEALKLHSEGQINLDNLNLLLSPVYHQFTGIARWNINWKQGPEGFFNVSDGSYRHLTLGTKLDSIQLKTRLHPAGITFEQGSATDGAGGKYTVKGFLNTPELLNSLASLSNDAKQPYTLLTNRKTSIELDLDHVKLIDRPDVESQSSGNIVFSHNDDKDTPYSLKGALQLQPLEIQLDRTQSDSVPEIQVTKYNPRFQSGAQTKSKQLPIGLNLNITTNQQAFLRGKGINAELEGNIKIRGTAQQPRISGYLQTLRGDADILGKRFTINTGEVRFDDMRALINIKATHTKADQTFTALVTGTAETLDVRLESDPPLPDDETLSQLLFGKSLDDISAVQALRIAAAVRSFSSGGGGLDPLATTRNLLGVDQVTLDSEDTDTGDENYKLGVGKYINDRVYVEIQRSTDPTEPWQGQVQIEITPNISLETSAESNAGFNGVDINWKRDY